MVSASQRCWEGGRHRRSFRFLYLAQSPNPTKAAHGFPEGIDVRSSLFVLIKCSLMRFSLTFMVPKPKRKSRRRCRASTCQPIFVRHGDQNLDVGGFPVARVVAVMPRGGGAVAVRQPELAVNDRLHTG
jgi:hypothetical protein